MQHGNHASANFSFSDASIENSATWFPDTGANQHVTPDITGMTHAKPYLGNDQLHVGNGKGLVISNTAYKILRTPKRVFTLSNVLHVPKIKKKDSYLLNNSAVKVVSSLNFTLLFSMLRISSPRRFCFPVRVRMAFMSFQKILPRLCPKLFVC
jgi:hypothetical protein